MGSGPWVGIREIAARFGLSVHTCYKLAQRGVIPCGRAGRRLVFNLAECDAWARARGSRGRVDFPAGEERAQEQQAQEIAGHILEEAGI